MQYDNSPTYAYVLANSNAIEINPISFCLNSIFKLTRMYFYHQKFVTKSKT